MLKRHFSHTLFVQLVSTIGRCSLHTHSYRSIIEFFLFQDLTPVTDKIIKSEKNHTIVLTESQEETTITIDNEKIVAHDILTPEQIKELKHKDSEEHKNSEEHSKSIEFEFVFVLTSLSIL